MEPRLTRITPHSPEGFTNRAPLPVDVLPLSLKMDLPFDFAQRLATPLSKLADHDEQLRELSHQLFVAALKQCHGNRSRGAVLLGLTRNKFYKLLKLHGLDGESSRNGPGESDWIQ